MVSWLEIKVSNLQAFLKLQLAGIYMYIILGTCPKELSVRKNYF